MMQPPFRLDTAGVPRPSEVTYYWSPGGPLDSGLKLSLKFISFLYQNQADGLRVKWYDLTGREQFEWYNAWVANSKTHRKVAIGNVRGLRGTDLTTITTEAELREALLVSPSAIHRRPNGHTHSVDTWTGTKRNLGFADAD